MPNSSPLLFCAFNPQKKPLVHVKGKCYQAKDDFSPTDLKTIRSCLAQSGYLATCTEIDKDQSIISLTYNSSSTTPSINAWSREETIDQAKNQPFPYHSAGPSSLFYPAAILYALHNKGGPFKNAYNESPRLSLTEETYKAIWNFYLKVSTDAKWNGSPLQEIYKEFNRATAQPQPIEKAQRPADQIDEKVMAQVLLRLVSAKYQTVYLDGKALEKNPNSKASRGEKTSAEIITGIGKDKKLGLDWHKYHLALEEIELAARINLVARVNVSDYGSRKKSLPGKPEDFLGELKNQSTQRALIYVCAPEMREGASYALERNELIATPEEETEEKTVNCKAINQGDKYNHTQPARFYYERYKEKVKLMLVSFLLTANELCKENPSFKKTVNIQGAGLGAFGLTNIEGPSLELYYLQALEVALNELKKQEQDQLPHITTINLVGLPSIRNGQFKLADNKKSITLHIETKTAKYKKSSPTTFNISHTELTFGTDPGDKPFLLPGVHMVPGDPASLPGNEGHTTIASSQECMVFQTIQGAGALFFSGENLPISNFLSHYNKFSSDTLLPLQSKKRRTGYLSLTAAMGMIVSMLGPCLSQYIQGSSESFGVNFMHLFKFTESGQPIALNIACSAAAAILFCIAAGTAIQYLILAHWRRTETISPIEEARAAQDPS